MKYTRFYKESIREEIVLSLFHHKYLYLAVVQGHAAYKGEEFKLQKLLPLWPPIYGDPLPSKSDTPCAMPDMPDGTLSLNGVLGRCPSLKRMTLSSITTLKEIWLYGARFGSPH